MLGIFDIDGKKCRMNLREIVIPTHPIFRVPSNRIFWINTVQKENRNGSLSPRIFVIATPGLFLIEKRKFPQKFVISRLIPWKDLIFVQVEGEKMTFCMARVTISIYHPDVVDIIAHVLTIRQLLFGDAPRPVTIKIPEDIYAKINHNNLIIEMPSVISDRFLSFCLSISPYSINTDQINGIYEQLKNDPGVVFIGPQILASPLIDPLALSIAFDSSVHSLRLKNVEFSTIAPHIQCIFSQNEALNRIIFFAVSFRSKTVGFFKESKTKLTELIFTDCPLNSRGVTSFFECLREFPGSVKKLTFANCNFNEEVIENIIVSVLSHKCFRTLQSFSFIECKGTDNIQDQMMQFVMSDYLLVSQNLKKLEITNAGIQLDLFLPFITSIDNGLSTIYLNNNIMARLDKIESFHHIRELSLSGCMMNSSSLLSLFQNLKNAQNAPSTLLLDNLNLSASEWSAFYKGIGSIVLPISSLSWSSNVVVDESFESFCTFLESQRSLTHLSVSGCFLLINAHSQIPRLCKLVQSLKLESFVMRGISESIFGGLLVPLLNSFLQTRTLKSLDITGQAVGDSGIEVLVNLSQVTLETLLFDKSTPQTPSAYLDALRLMSRSKLISAEWPTEDARSILVRMPLGKRAEFSKEMESIRKIFERSLLNVHDEDTQSLPTIARRPSLVPRRANDIRRQADLLCIRDKEVDDAIEDCFGSTAIEEPLLAILKEIDFSTSVSTLLECLPQK